jgi:hypothetical protein
LVITVSSGTPWRGLRNPDQLRPRHGSIRASEDTIRQIKLKLLHLNRGICTRDLSRSRCLQICSAPNRFITALPFRPPTKLEMHLLFYQLWTAQPPLLTPRLPLPLLVLLPAGAFLPFEALAPSIGEAIGFAVLRACVALAILTGVGAAALSFGVRPGDRYKNKAEECANDNRKKFQAHLYFPSIGGASAPAA